MPKPIVIWPDKVLSTRTRRVTEFGPALDPLLEEMMESLRAAEGIGIAANQIGVSARDRLGGPGGRHLLRDRQPGGAGEDASR